mgnify:CR=1 FL=1|jgi:hypothetical protein
MVTALTCDPFELFPEQVETVELWKYASSARNNIKLADMQAIVKRSTNSDAFGDYGTRIATRRLHVKTETIPADLRDPDQLLDLIIKAKNRTYKITQASQGDDMTNGTTTFITIYAQPYGRNTL